MSYPVFPSRDRGVLALSIVSLAALAVAGCVQPAEPNPTFVASGSGGVYFDGWDYEAATRTPIQGSLSVDVHEPDNTGLIRVGGFWEDPTLGQVPLRILIENFSHNEDDFHSGGIAANFEEHGDSGVGNTLLPRMDLLLATWGDGKVRLVDGNNSTEWRDPYTGGTSFAAHLMVTDTGVRDDADARVLKADGSTPYDPSAPGDAKVGDDTEAHLVLTSTSDAEKPEDLELDLSGAIEGANGAVEKTFEIPIPAGAIAIHVDLGDDPTEVYNYNFRVSNPEGQTIAGKTVSSQRPSASTVLYANATQAGTYTFWAGGLTPGDFTATGTVTFPDKPVHYFFWEQVTIDERVVP